MHMWGIRYAHLLLHKGYLSGVATNFFLKAWGWCCSLAFTESGEEN